MAVVLDFLQSAIPVAAKDTIQSTHLYIDLKLDLVLDYTRSSQLLKTQEVNDLTAIYDYDAVAQSLRNLFMTLPGQKILNPEYGLDLRKYLFDNVNTRVGYIIGLELNDLIPVYEPRVSVTKLNVKSDAEQNQYNIEIFYTVPSLATKQVEPTKLDVALNQTGFTII